MIEFNNLTTSEQESIILRADKWLSANQDKFINKDCSHPFNVEPMNEDLYSPEKWTRSNWNWFFEHLKTKNKVTLSKILSNIIPKNLFLIK